jgi:hypothetical protein
MAVAAERQATIGAHPDLRFCQRSAAAAWLLGRRREANPYPLGSATAASPRKAPQIRFVPPLPPQFAGIDYRASPAHPHGLPPPSRRGDTLRGGTSSACSPQAA